METINSSKHRTNDKCPTAVNDGSNAPGSTDTIPRAVEIGIAMIRQIKKSKNTTAADIYFPPFLHLCGSQS